MPGASMCSCVSPSASVGRRWNSLALSGSRGVQYLPFLSVTWNMRSPTKPCLSAVTLSISTLAHDLIG
eukprot:2804554-Prymnesium_polylepis.1